MKKFSAKAIQLHYYVIVLGRFQNLPVPVLSLKKHTVPVSTGSSNCIAFGSGSMVVGSSVLTVLLIWHKRPISMALW